jgi:PhzF family phenazine biosynthesis protein|tara:strand:+ start:615 stop:1487 length:873 start_codon:yes stop_codon:yes gene_type:complete
VFLWGCSSAGRAPALHAGGQEFDSPQLHQFKMNQKIYFVDTFTEKTFSGNAAGVVFHKGEIDGNTMQNIAFENNLSETAFINTAKENEIKFYSPTIEVDLCGHATLASAFIFFNFIDKKATDTIFKSNRGELKVTKKEDSLVMSLPKDYPRKIDDIEKISDALNCQVIEVFRGIDDFLAIVKDESIVETIDPNIEKIAELDSRGLIVSAKGETTDFTSRVFGPNVGVDEDPVTGSAHALLATYWGDVLNLQKMKARQASKRGGELICEVLENNVEITGKAKLYLQGEIYF